MITENEACKSRAGVGGIDYDKLSGALLWDILCGAVASYRKIVADQMFLPYKGIMSERSVHALPDHECDLTAADAPSYVVASGYTTGHKIFCCLCCAFMCTSSPCWSSRFPSHP